MKHLLALLYDCMLACNGHVQKPVAVTGLGDLLDAWFATLNAHTVAWSLHYVCNMWHVQDSHNAQCFGANHFRMLGCTPTGVDFFFSVLFFRTAFF